MKISRMLAGLCAVAMLGAAGCSAQSPDFTPRLQTITIAPAAAQTLAAGETQQFSASETCSTPPGSAASSQPCVKSVSWAVDNALVGSVNGSGLFKGLSTGTVVLTASADGITSNPVTITVTRPKLVSVSIVDGVTQGAAKTTLTLGSSASYLVLGTYTDSATARQVDTDSTIAWSSDKTAVADPNPKNKATTSLTPAATGTMNLSVLVTPVAGAGSAQTAQLPITVTNNVPTNLAPAVKLNPPTVVAPGAGTPTIATQSQATAVAVFADGSKQDVANDGNTVTWSSAPTTIATINATTGLATSVAKGQAIITATPKPGKFSGSQTPATATLTVTDPVCPVPLLATGGATASDATSGICLLCSAANDSNVTDGDFNNFATLSVPVALLTGSISLTVKAGSTVTPVAGQQAGFVIGRPTGSLLLAEVLSQVQLSTSLNGTATSDTTSNQTPLRLDLLGTEVTGAQAGLVSMPVTKPFDSITLTFGGGVASALSSVQVFQACAAVKPPQ